MTQPLPIDISALLDELPDPAHENLRSHVVSAIQAVWVNHLDLLGKLTASQGQLAATGQTIAALQASLDSLTARVTALETPAPAPAPDPAPVPTPAPAPAPNPAP